MKTIYKYPLRIVANQLIELPQGAEILSCQLQNNTLCIWAEVNPKVNLVKRKFLIYETGHIIERLSNRQFISTVQQGPFVWHIFESFVL